jgi:DNA-binding CsgD family transcriptional regulator
VHHANRAARQRLRCCTALALQQRSLQPARAHDAEALRAAVRDATGRGLRTSLVLPQGLRLAVTPCDTEAAPSLASVVLSRTQVCSTLALQTLARQHGLTEAERSVLQSLCQGRAPEEIARLHGVALCTVRTQVLGVRAKLGARSTRELITLLAAVPPLAALVAD